VSGNLRRDVIVSLAIGPVEDTTVISFPGNTLKRVSPDERSISFFLLKAIERTKEMEKGMTFTMDNGIKLARTSLNELSESWDSDVIQVPSTHPERFILDSNLAADRMPNTP
jgi:tRNA pseudouridine-54 N-methylase